MRRWIWMGLVLLAGCGPKALPQACLDALQIGKETCEEMNTRGAKVGIAATSCEDTEERKEMQLLVDTKDAYDVDQECKKRKSQAEIGREMLRGMMQKTEETKKQLDEMKGK